MDLIRGYHNLRPQHRGCVLSIGNYDGVHRGHQALLAQLRRRAVEFGVPAAVQIFEPTPREVFAAQQAPGRVQTLRDKLAALRDQSVERVLCVRFSQAFAARTAESFVRDMLVAQLGVKAIVVGEDFCFGAGRGGNIQLLRTLGAAHDFVVDAVADVLDQGQRVSSTAIRTALAQPDLARAADLLGRPLLISGRVGYGRQLGRTLDMPTANIALRRRPALRLGVYAVRVRVGQDSQWQPAVANLGQRPSVTAERRVLLETHLLGQCPNLYGRCLQVRIEQFIRPEQKFDSLDALKLQMQADRARAETLLRSDKGS